MKKSLVAAMFAVMMISLAGCGTEVKTVETETTEVVSVEPTEVVEAVPETEATEEVVEEETETVKEETTEVVAEEPTSPYSYTDLSQTMYAQSTVNVRDLPEQSGGKLGSLTTNQEVTVTGQCNETGWYRISYNGSEGFVSNSYLGSEQVAVKSTSKSSSASQSQSSTASSSQSASSEATQAETPAQTETMSANSESNVHSGDTTPEQVIENEAAHDITPDSYHCWYCEEVFPTVDEMKAHTLAAHGVELP